MGVMFFPRDRTLAELRRVLKPGGRIGFTVWGDYERNPGLTRIREPVLRRVRQQQLLANGGPDPLRCATSGTWRSICRTPTSEMPTRKSCTSPGRLQARRNNSGLSRVAWAEIAMS
jgi:hypothetical protein